MRIDIQKLGEELICDALVRSPHLNSIEDLKRICLDALSKGDCNAIPGKNLFHQFQKQKTGHGDGITGLVVIEESHFHISTWPEKNYVQINLNTCGHTAKPMIALGHLLFALNVVLFNTQVLERGVPFQEYELPKYKGGEVATEEIGS
jgi:S-adenosylmethionine decarboxylase